MEGSKQDQYGFDADPYEAVRRGRRRARGRPRRRSRGRPRGRRSHLPQVDRPRAPAHQGRRGAAGEARRDERHGREELAHRGEPAARGLDRQALHGTRPHAARPDPGGQPRPHPRGREVRLAPRLQVLHIRDLVDPPGDHARARRPVAHDPDPGAHGRAHEQGRARAPFAAPGDRPRADTRGDRRPPRRHRRETGGGHPQARAGAGVARDAPSAARRATRRSATSSRTRSGSARTRRSPSSCATTTSPRRSRACRGASAACWSCATAWPATAR